MSRVGARRFTTSVRRRFDGLGRGGVLATRKQEIKLQGKNLHRRWEKQWTFPGRENLIRAKKPCDLSTGCKRAIGTRDHRRKRKNSAKTSPPLLPV